MRQLIYLIIVVIFLNGCSSLPKKREIVNPTKEQGDQLSNKAIQMEKAHYYQGAITYFNYALTKYQLTDDIESVLRTKIALSRQYYSLNQMSEYEALFAQTRSELKFYPQLLPLDIELSLFQVEVLYHNALYDSALVVLKTIKNENKEQELRKQSWDNLIRFELSKLNLGRIKTLKKSSEKAFARYKKKKFDSISAISFAYYALGYVSYHKPLTDTSPEAFKEKYRVSAEYFKQAYEADIIDQNFYNLSTDLYYLGSAYSHLGDYELASHYFLRAYNVYKQINETDKRDYSYFYYLKNRWESKPSQGIIDEMNEFKKLVSDKELLDDISEWFQGK